MWDLLRRSPLAVTISIAMHVAIILLMVFGLDWLREPEPSKPRAPVVQARMIDETRLKVEIDKLKSAQKVKQDAQNAAQLEEQKRIAELEKKRKAEKKKLAQLEAKRKQQEREVKAREKKAKQAAEAEKKRLAELKRKKAAEQKALAELESKRKAEQKRKADAERQRKAEAEKKRKAELARKKAEEERKRKERDAALAAEAEAEQDAREIDQVIHAIKTKIQSNWLQPPGTSGKGLKCTLQVRLGGSGSVLLARVVQSSGNGSFDRSVETAVRKAEPLPMPTSPRLKQKFRDIEFVFDPRR